MISIIICSRGSGLPHDLKQSIADTIGCDYEFVVIDNSENKYSIFEAYNEGVKRSLGDILCFCHDDVLFYTDDWGKKVSAHLLDHREVGAVGFLGGHYLPQRPCYWAEPRVESVHYIQGETVEGIYSTRRIDHHKYRKDRTLVAAIDGVFMAMRRDVFTEFHLRWDDESFKGFHFYDADMCMQIHAAGLNIEVLWDVWMEHKSCGTIGDSFIKARQVWYDKWQESLPIICGIEMTEEDIDICRIIMDITDQSYQYLKIKSSLAYRLGKAILHPTKTNLKRLFSH